MVNYKENCIACQIQRREISTQIVHETDQVLCFFSYEPIQAGHTLIIPKGHYPNLIDLPNTLSSALWDVSRYVYQRLETIYQPDGISLMQNNGIFNDLEHYHLHIWPRYKDDGFDWISPFEKRRSPTWLAQEAEKWE